jgi:hypothetical protein
MTSSRYLISSHINLRNMYSLIKNCIILAFYPYTSHVKDTILSVDSKDREGLTYRAFEDFGELFRNHYYVKQEDKSWKSGFGQWDNKVSFKCQSRDGNIFYVGRYDGKWSIGLGVESDHDVRQCLPQDKLYCIVKDSSTYNLKTLSDVKDGEDIVLTTESLGLRLLTLKKLNYLASQ